jgi:hypothetical protein
MPYTKHIFTYAQENGVDKKIKHETEVGLAPSSDLDIVEIELRGCPRNTILERVPIERDTFVVLRPKFADGCLDDQEASKTTPLYIDFVIEGINQAALVYSDIGVYPYNLDDEVPVFDDLTDRNLRARIRGAESFIEYIEEVPKDGQPRNKHYRLR